MRRAQLAEAPQQLAAAAPRFAVGQRIAAERPFGGEPSLAVLQLWAALITVVAIVTRTISIAVEVPTTVVAAQSSQAALLFAAEPPSEAALLFAAEPPLEVARVVRAAEAEQLAASRGLRGKMT